MTCQIGVGGGDGDQGIIHLCPGQHLRVSYNDPGSRMMTLNLIKLKPNDWTFQMVILFFSVNRI